METKSKIAKNFGDRVRKLRDEAGYSQESFADVVGFDRSYMGKVERGESNLTINNVARIAKALKLTLSELLDGVKY